MRPDNQAIGTLAADHLLSTGCHRFLFISFQNVSFARHRFEGFRERLEKTGHTTEWFVWKPTVESSNESLHELLTTPTGIFVADDTCARRLSEQMEVWQLSIPKFVKLVSCNNDLRICTMTTVPLSSIDLNSERIGWLASEMLSEMMDGHPGRHRTVAPTGVVERESSQPSVLDDPELDFALTYIREHACKGMKIHDIMEHLEISRRTLETRFSSRFNRTLHEEIRRVRMTHAQKLLMETEMRIGDVATHCGYHKHSVFTDEFTREFGIAPSKFRRDLRMSSL